MGHLKNIANQPKLQTFPSSTFEIQGEVPTSQCSEARIEGDDATTEFMDFGKLHDPDKFIGENLNGKILTITKSTGGNTGDFPIIVTFPSRLEFFDDCGDGTEVEYYIHNGGSLILTRDIKSFADFISAAGYSYTIKNGKLYTNIPSEFLQPACSILFDPLT